MGASLLARYVRALFLFPAVAGAVVLASCADRQPTDPSLAGPLFETTATSCPTFDVPLSGTNRMTPATLCASHDAFNWYLTLQLRDPANAAGSVLRLLAKQDGTDIWDEKLFKQSAYTDNHRLSPYSTTTLDHDQHGTISRSGSNGSSTYYITVPRYPTVSAASTAGSVPDPQDLTLTETVDFRIQLDQGGDSGYYPSATGWETYVFEGDDETPPPPPADDPRPDLTVITNVQGTVLVRTFLEDESSLTGYNSAYDDYRVQLPDYCDETQTPKLCFTTFYDLPQGSKPVVSALGGPWFLARGEREVAPKYFAWTERQGTKLQEGYVFVQNPSSALFGEGASLPLIPDNYYPAVDNALALDGNGTIQITLGNTATSIVKCYFASGVREATVHAVHPLTGNVPSGFGGLGDLQPGLSPFVDGYTRDGSDPCEVYINNTISTVLAAEDEAGTKYNILVGPGETEAVMVPIANYYASRYVVDPWNDASPQDLGQVTYGAIRDANGAETPKFSVTTQVRGTVTNKKRETFNRSTLELLVGGQTVKVTVLCTRPSGGTGNLNCTAQEVSKGWGTKVAVSGFVTVDATGSRGYTRVDVDLSGLVPRGTEVRLRVRTGDNGSDNDFAPDDGLTKEPNIVNGYAIYTFGGASGQSWKLTF
ncbi:MAG: hypothetical protein H0V67_04915 [Geodermatophilaceae bacterium]|nr:hypothetical protein [Geodermatophilaceae bacterium]